MKKYNFFQDDSKVRFQNFLLDEWFFRTKKIIDENYSTKRKSCIIISERSPLTNMFIFINKLHKESQLSDVDHHLLVNKSLEFQRLIIEDYQLSPLYIYLSTSFYYRIRKFFFFRWWWWYRCKWQYRCCSITQNNDGLNRTFHRWKNWWLFDRIFFYQVWK